MGLRTRNNEGAIALELRYALPESWISVNPASEFGDFHGLPRRVTRVVASALGAIVTCKCRARIPIFQRLRCVHALAGR